MKKFITPFLSLITWVLVLFGFSFESKAQQKSETVAITGHLIRVTPKLADIDNTTMYGEPLKITRDMNGIIVDGSGDFARNKRETKRKLEEEMKARLDKEYQEAIKNNKTESLQRPDPSPTPNIPGTSIGVNIDGLTSPGLQPTDNNMAAGPNHFIQIVNNTSGSQYRIFNKAGGVLATGILASLTGRTGSGDPIVLYDQLADRWFMAEFGPSACCNELIIAVSNTSNPTGTWSIYNYIDPTFFPDYPKFSVWHNAYYAYTNDFNPPGTAFLGTSVWAFDRTAMLAGAATAQMLRQRLALTNMIAMGSVGLEGMTTSTQNGLFIIPTSATQLSIFEVTPNFGASTLTIGPLTPLPVNAWASSGSIPQQTGSNLGSLSPRMMFKVNYRNNGGTESIVTCHTIGNGGLGQVRWYELRRVAGNWTVFQQGNVAGTDGNSRWMPAISMDGCGNIALMYSVAGTGAPAAHPSIRYTGRNAADPVNTMTLPEATIINGATNFGGFRWGDYNATVQDYSAAGVPANNSFWATNQYGNQLTRIANFTLTGGCAAAPVIISGTATLVTESCVPNNGVVDPGETVTMSFCLLNSGTLPTVNAVGTLQVSGGVIAPSGPQNYGVIINGGPAVCRNFSFTNTSSTCLSTITASIQVQDGASNLGTVAFTIPIGTTANVTSQNFDGVAAPALPAGWTSVAANGPAWVTSNAGTPAPPNVSAPNAAYVPNVNFGDAYLETPVIAIAAAGTVVSFQNNFNVESGWDGGKLFLSINGGAYNDVITAGGTFLSGGYNGTINSGAPSPFAGLPAWTGTSGGFINSSVRLPNSTSGQNIRLRFRMASDDIITVQGWRVDNVSVDAPACCGSACTITCPANITVSSSPTACGANVTFPAATTTGLCGPVTYSPANGSFFPIGTTTVTATTAAGPSCTFTVTVVDNVPPTITCPANMTVSNSPGLCAAVVNYSLPTVTDNCPLPGIANLNQTTNSTTITPGVSVACGTGPNQWWRAYDLAPLALPAPLTITNVRFGVEQANAAQTVTVRLFTSAGAFPAGARTQIASQTVAVPAGNNLFFTVVLASPPTVPVNAIVVAQVDVPNGGWWIGANSLGQSAPGYISAPACAVPAPVTLASLGFPNDHIILGITGTYPVVPPVLTQLTGLPPGGTFPLGTTTNTFQARDGAGNTATCSFTVTVNDTEQPVFTLCPAPVIRNTDLNLCYATYTPQQPTFTDNCGVTRLTWVMSGATTGSNTGAGINYVPSTQFQLTGTTGVGVTTIVYTAYDAAGNTRTCTFTVTVNDAQIPVITTQPSNRFVCVGSPGSFEVIATANGGPIAYQWQRWDGTTLTWVNIAAPAGTVNPYITPPVSFADNTNTFRCRLIGRCSEVISGAATLYVNPLPTVNITPSIPPSLVPGQVLSISSTVNPAGGTYRWFRNGVLYSSPLQQLPVLSGLTVDDIGTIRLVYTDLNGCVNTSPDVVITGLPSDKLWVYPVPNNGTFQVRFFNTLNESATVRVWDAKGSEVYRRTAVTTTPYTKIVVDLGPAIADGVYLVELVNSSGNRVDVKKIVVRQKP
ncbi:MAG: HYR domain-containing protein [Bacteroidota bacterium]